LLARAGIRCGLWSTQQDDFPISVLTGFSLSDVILSPDRIEEPERVAADYLIVLSDEGIARFRKRGRRAGKVYRLADTEPIEGAVEIPERSRVGKEYVAIYGIAQFLQRESILPPERFRETIEAHGFRGDGKKELERQIDAAS
jgi:hypothetical protein